MGRREEAEELFKKGYSPEQISQKMRVSLGTVISYLYTKVGEGKIRHSDILFSIDKNIRNMIEQTIRTIGTTSLYGIYNHIYKYFGTSVSPTYIQTYIQLTKPTFLLKDMYELVMEIKVKLHKYIRDILADEYGDEDWWTKGVPENVRLECENTQNSDPNPADHPYIYTNFVHFKEILDGNWDTFSKKLPPSISSNRKKFLEDLVTLNGILNKVMYPFGESLPTEEEFEFVKKFLRDIESI